MTEALVLDLTAVRQGDVGRVGGKNASLGEMIQALSAAGVRVPPGFATTAAAYRAHLDAHDLRPRIEAALARYHEGTTSLQDTGAAIRRMLLDTDFTPDLTRAIRDAYRALGTSLGTTDPAHLAEAVATTTRRPAG